MLKNVLQLCILKIWFFQLYIKVSNYHEIYCILYTAYDMLFLKFKKWPKLNFTNFFWILQRQKMFSKFFNARFRYVVIWTLNLMMLKNVKIGKNCVCHVLTNLSQTWEIRHDQWTLILFKYSAFDTIHDSL